MEGGAALLGGGRAGGGPCRQQVGMQGANLHYRVIVRHTTIVTCMPMLILMTDT